MLSPQIQVGLIGIADPQLDLVSDRMADAGGDLDHGLRVRAVENDVPLHVAAVWQL